MRFALVTIILGTTPARADGGGGAVVLAKQVGGPNLDHGWGLGFDRQGNLVMSGFGDEPDAVHVTAFAPNGRERWSLRHPLRPAYYAGPMALDDDGAVLLVGD